ncbi:MAG: adenosylhomocysteinase, partial [Methanomassiliicoccales archaeon]|nr:adenosylhomocysteinase [Methanomassiliicoccales archaeon]
MDRELLLKGSRRLGWAEAHMNVLKEVGGRMQGEGSLKGVKVGMALHVEAKTGMLAVTLARAGAKVRLASCNPLSTDDSVALALREERGIEVFARKGESHEEYYQNLNDVLDMHPDFVIDDGADLITMLHTVRKEQLKEVKGGNEETTTGVIRLKAMASAGKLNFPVMAVNDARMKYLFDNRYGTGQSTFDGFMNATNLLVAGKT